MAFSNLSEDVQELFSGLSVFDLADHAKFSFRLSYDANGSAKARDAERYASRVRRGLCYRCGYKKIGEHRTICALCLPSARASWRNYRERKVAVGICRTCAKPARDGVQTCGRCKDKASERRRKCRARRIAEGACPYCLKPADFKSCETCRVKAQVRQRELRRQRREANGKSGV